MQLDSKDPKVIGGAIGMVVLLLALLAWALSASHHAAEVQRLLDDALSRQDDDDHQLADSRHLLEGAQALADKRGQERDALTAENHKLHDSIADSEREVRAANAAEAQAEAARDHSAREAEMAQTERAKAVQDRDHQYQMWRNAQDRYDDLLKSVQQQAQDNATKTDGAAKP